MTAKAASGVPKFGQMAAEFIAAKSPGWRSDVHRNQWTTTVEKYCGQLLDKPVDQIALVDVLAVLQPIWQTIPETANRVRGRIESILDAAKARGWRAGLENPAAWRGNLAHLLARRPKIAAQHFAAMDYREIPAFLADLHDVGGVSQVAARAIEFLILTAARSGEVNGATWQEVDLAAKVWTIPAERMKGGITHRVPLSDRAVEILIVGNDDQNPCSDFPIFPGLGRTTMSKLLKRMVPSATVHGLRSSFRDWAGEETSFPSEIAEQALAHSVGNEVERSYRRGDALEKRRALMTAWASYCAEAPAANVVKLHR